MATGTAGNDDFFTLSGFEINGHGFQGPIGYHGTGVGSQGIGVNLSPNATGPNGPPSHYYNSANNYYDTIDMSQRRPLSNPKELIDTKDEPTEDQNKQCCICLDNEKTYAFIPCGHFICCGSCAKRIYDTKRCPKCRQPFEQVIKMYH